MRINISISVGKSQFNEVAERELVVEVPDGSTALFAQVAFGPMVEEHLASAVEEYAKTQAAANAAKVEVEKAA